MIEDNFILVGKIIGAHGLKGEVKIKSFTEDPTHIFDYQIYFKSSTTPLTIIKKGIVKDLFIVSLPISNNRNEAEKIIGYELYIESTQLKSLTSEEFYYKDLIGLNLIDDKQKTYGKVMAMHNFGAGDIMEIQLPEKKETEYISFSKHTIKEVNVDGGYIIFTPDQKI